MNLPDRAVQAALAHVGVYLDNFIGVVQGQPEERKHITWHLSSFIYSLFQTKNPLKMAREEPILLKKPAKGDAQWSTEKTVLVWAIKNSKQIIMPPSMHRDEL